MPTRPVLLIGYGNPGRLDDGLGPALIEALSAAELPDVQLEADYQLTIEDAAELPGRELVVFVDAALSGPEPFSVERVTPRAQELGFSSHSIDPSGVLALGRDLFAAKPEAFLVGVRGYEFDAFGEQLSPDACANLEAARVFLVEALRGGLANEALAARCLVDTAGGSRWHAGRKGGPGGDHARD